MNRRYSPSKISTFLDCQARFWFGGHDDGSGLLPSDELPMRVGRAIHDTLTELQRQLSGIRALAAIPTGDRLARFGQSLLRTRLRTHGLEAVPPAIESRLTTLRSGFDLATRVLVDEMGDWAIERGMRLVWTERSLDHGPESRVVLIGPGAESITRADLIGVRRDGRVVVRDYKTGRRPVDPETDPGVLVRAVWAWQEIRRPRAGWFIARRSVRVTPDVVETEIVNLSHPETDYFHLQRTLDEPALARERDWLLGVFDRMIAIDDSPDPSQAMAAPGGLCHHWCPYLHRCRDGKEYVRDKAGPEALAARIGRTPLEGKGT